MSPIKVATTATARELDRRAQEEFHIPGDDLMSEAGRAVAREVIDRFETGPVVVVCGKGNNGGDGIMAARTLTEFGYPVTLVMTHDFGALQGSAARAFDGLHGVGVPVADFEDLETLLEGAPLVIDAVLGIGSRGPAEGPAARAIEAINECKSVVVAIDVPSGLREMAPGDDPGPIVRADLTVTMGLSKLVLLTTPGWLHAGEVVVAPINFPVELLTDPEIDLNFADTSDLLSFLPPRPADSNKGIFGRVGIVAGSAEAAGAAILCARAALRSGAGLVTIFTPRSLNAIYKAALPEALTVIVETGGDEDHLTDASAERILERAKNMNVLAIGPGLGTQPTQAALLTRLLEGFSGSIVLDADAITILANHPRAFELIHGRSNVLLTPHPGEMARLISTSVEAVQADRIATVRQFVQDHAVTLLLKGATTLVGAADGQIFINAGATSVLAKGGTGDVLTGLTAALMAQGVTPPQAAVLGAQVHLSAGLSLAERNGERGLLASELADELPRAMASLEQPHIILEPEPPDTTEPVEEDATPWR